MMTRSFSEHRPFALERLLGSKDLRDGRIPVSPCATDLISGDRVSIRSGSAMRATYASSALAGVPHPLRLGTKYLADGAYSGIAPIDVAREMMDVTVVAVDPGQFTRLGRSGPAFRWCSVRWRSATRITRTRSLPSRTSSSSRPSPASLTPSTSGHGERAARQASDSLGSSESRSRIFLGGGTIPENDRTGRGVFHFAICHGACLATGWLAEGSTDRLRTRPARERRDDARLRKRRSHWSRARRESGRSPRRNSPED